MEVDVNTLSPDLQRAFKMANERRVSDHAVNLVKEGEESKIEKWQKKVICTMANTGTFEIKFKLAPDETIPLTQAEFNRLIRGLKLQYTAYKRQTLREARIARRIITEKVLSKPV